MMHFENLLARARNQLSKLSRDVVRNGEPLFSRWVNVSFFVVIAGFVVQYTHQKPSIIFAINLVAVFPSSTHLGTALKSLGIRYGRFAQAILYMTFGNAVQLITSVILLKNRQIDILQKSLIGGILSNMHLMLGMGVFLGGFHRMEQHYNVTVAGTYSSLLILSVAGLIFPTASQLLATPRPGGIQSLSRAIAVIFLTIYIGLLLFQLKTHHTMTAMPAQKTPNKRRDTDVTETTGKVAVGLAAAVPVSTAGTVPASADTVSASAEVSKRTHPLPMHQTDTESIESENEVPKIGLWTSIIVLVICTSLIGFNTTFATDSLQGIMESKTISASFVGIVLLPIFTNDPEPIMAAIKDDMDMCLQFTVGRCIQTVLFVMPLVILLAWMMRIQEMTLQFNGFDVTALFASVLYISSLIQNGKSLWFEGAALLAMFMIISISAWYIE